MTFGARTISQLEHQITKLLAGHRQVALGQSVAWIGYVGILVALAVPGEAGRLATALIAFSGFGYSAYLTWVELARIEAICQWCVISAAIMTALAILAAVRVLRDSPPAAPSVA